jgi:hypothetical protein
MGRRGSGSRRRRCDRGRCSGSRWRWRIGRGRGGRRCSSSSRRRDRRRGRGSGSRWRRGRLLFRRVKAPLMERCSIARRGLGTSRHRRAGGIGQKVLITKGQQPETYNQQADDDGRTDDTTPLYIPTSNFQAPTSIFHLPTSDCNFQFLQHFQRQFQRCGNVLAGIISQSGGYLLGQCP